MRESFGVGNRGPVEKLEWNDCTDWNLSVSFQIDVYLHKVISGMDLAVFLLVNRRGGDRVLYFTYFSKSDGIFG